MEFLLLASMVFADGALSESRSPCFETFTGFDPPWFDLFRHASLVQSVCNLRYALIFRLSWHIGLNRACRTPGFISDQQNPSDTCHFVGQRDRHLIGMAALQQLFYPRVPTRLTGPQATLNMIDHGSRAVDQQASQVTVTPLADAQ